MDKNNEMAHPFKPGETSRQDIPEQPLKRVEHAYNPADRALAVRRRLMGAALGIGMATAFVGISSIPGNSDIKMETDTQNYNAQIEQMAKTELYKADRFKDGKYEISINNPNDNTQLNLRAAPYIEDNILDWSQVESIDGTKIPTGINSFIIEDPLISTGQEPTDKSKPADWISLDLTLKNGESKRAFISTVGTGGHIQPLESGTIKPLSMSNENDNIGVVTVNPQN